MDIIHETNSLMCTIIFTCTYGKDIGQNLMDISVGGKIKTHTIAYLIEYLMSFLFMRGVTLKGLLFRELINLYFNSEEKE